MQRIVKTVQSIVSTDQVEDDNHLFHLSMQRKYRNVFQSRNLWKNNSPVIDTCTGHEITAR